MECLFMFGLVNADLRTLYSMLLYQLYTKVNYNFKTF